MWGLTLRGSFHGVNSAMRAALSTLTPRPRRQSRSQWNCWILRPWNCVLLSYIHEFVRYYVVIPTLLGYQVRVNTQSKFPWCHLVLNLLTVCCSVRPRMIPHLTTHGSMARGWYIWCWYLCGCYGRHIAHMCSWDIILWLSHYFCRLPALSVVDRLRRLPINNYNVVLIITTR